MKAFYFAPPGNRLQYGDNRLIRVGITHTVQGPLKLCHNGLHGSERIIDALKYAETTLLYRTDHGGDILRGDDKLCSIDRGYLKRFELNKILPHFARRQALLNIDLIKGCQDFDLIVDFLETGDSTLAARAERAARAAWADQETMLIDMIKTEYGGDCLEAGE